MTAARRTLPLLIVVACLAVPGCHRARRDLEPAGTTGAIVGQYKGRIEGSDRVSRQFRLLLFAALRDRLHAEVLSPLGTMQLILDGGRGSLAITFVSEGVSFVGPARPEALARILGVPLSLEELVRGLLTGEIENDDITLVRTGDRNPGLPERLEIRADSSSLELRLKRPRQARALEEELGTGRPPENTEVRPIEELEREGRRLQELLP